MPEGHGMISVSWTPPPSPPPRAIYEGKDGQGDPWPVLADDRVIILDGMGRPTESSPARCVKAGEYVEIETPSGPVRGRMH
jgi:hypothetical protein